MHDKLHTFINKIDLDFIHNQEDILVRVDDLIGDFVYVMEDISREA